LYEGKPAVAKMAAASMLTTGAIEEFSPTTEPLIVPQTDAGGVFSVSGPYAGTKAVLRRR